MIHQAVPLPTIRRTGCWPEFRRVRGIPDLYSTPSSHHPRREEKGGRSLSITSRSWTSFVIAVSALLPGPQSRFIVCIQLPHGDHSRDLVNSIAVKPFVAIRGSIL